MKEGFWLRLSVGLLVGASFAPATAEARRRGVRPHYWQLWSNAVVVAKLKVVQVTPDPLGVLVVSDVQATYRGDATPQVTLLGNRTWQRLEVDDEFVAYLNSPIPGSHGYQVLQSYGAEDGFIVAASRGSLSLQQQEALANTFATRSPVDAASLGHSEGRIAALFWAEETADPSLMDIFNQVLNNHQGPQEAGSLVAVSAGLFPDPDVRAATLHPVLATAVDAISASLLFEVFASSPTYAAQYLGDGVFSDEAIHRAAAVRWLHRIGYDPSIAWYLDIAAQTEFDGAVRSGLVQYYALTGRSDDLEIMYPTSLPTNPAVLRNFMLGLAIGASASGWARVKDASDDSSPVVRAISHEASAQLANGGSGLANDARNWLLGQQLDANTAVQLSHVHAVGRLSPASDSRQFLADVARNGSVSDDTAYAAAFRLMAECSNDVVPYAQSVAQETPHPSVAAAVSLTLEAWDGNGGPTCD